MLVAIAAAMRRVVGDFPVHGRAANRMRFPYGLFAFRRIDDKVI